jgi:hypothetical protein
MPVEHRRARQIPHRSSNATNCYIDDIVRKLHCCPGVECLPAELERFTHGQAGWRRHERGGFTRGEAR